MREGSKLYVETSKFVVPLDKKQQPKLLKAIKDVGQENNYKIEEFELDHHIKFTNNLKNKTEDTKKE